jgi:hypothetical protein
MMEGELLKLTVLLQLTTLAWWPAQNGSVFRLGM